MTDSTDQRIENQVEEAGPDESMGSMAVDGASLRKQKHPAQVGEYEVTTASIVEALLISTDVTIPASKIAQLLGIGDASDVKRYIESLNEQYEEAGTSFRIQAIAKGYQVLTLPVYDAWVRKLHKARADSRLSRAALETLAIVAYKQPVLRANVEAIRGVAVGDMLVRLREMNLIRIAGRAEEIGRPLLYGTTRKFLDVFGLSSLHDLPKLDREIELGESFPKLVMPTEEPEEGSKGNDDLVEGAGDGPVDREADGPSAGTPQNQPRED